MPIHAMKSRKKGVVRGIRRRKVPLKPQAPVTQLRTKLQLTQPEFARLLPYSVRSLATFESGKAPTDAFTRRFIEIKRLIDALAEIMKPESIGGWLKTPNPAFDGQKPLEVIERGEADRLWSMIYFIRSGVPT